MSGVLRHAKELSGRLTAVFPRLSGHVVDTAIALLVTVLGLVLFAFVGIGGNTSAVFSFLQNVEQRSLDARFAQRGKRPLDERIVIVGIDEKTLQKVGSWPISRAAYAQAVDKLNTGGARVIAFDVTFPTPEKNSAMEALNRVLAELGPVASPAVIEKIRQVQRSSDNDVLFAESMKKAGNVVLGHLFLNEQRAKDLDPKAQQDYFEILWGRPFPKMQKVSGGRDFDLDRAWTRNDGTVAFGVESNIRLLAEAAKSYGFFDQHPDPDGTLRRAVLLIRYKNLDFYPSLPFQAVREFESIKDQSIVGYLSENGLERIEFGPNKLNTFGDATLLVNYAGPYRTYTHYSMADVLGGTVPPQAFAGKIVLVGATAVGIGDLRSTPFGKQDTGYMGVEIHANVIDNLLHNEERGRGFLTRGLNEELIDIAFIVIFGMGMGLLFGRIKPLISTASVVVAVLGFAGVVYYAFAHWGMWLSFVVPAGVLVLNYGGITSYRMIFEEREKRKIRKSFASYVSPGVIRLIEKEPKKYFHVGGETKELTIMFSDIRSFTTISEELSPDQLVGLLNEYLGEMTDIVFQRWGTLDKYIGDAIMAFWGSPFPQEDHFVRACACALEMQARLEELNLKWEAQGRKQLQVGVGINTGRVTVGNMGSSKRLAWTCMGDSVNLASRLEGLTKAYHVRNIISEFTYQKVAEHFVCRDLDRIRVKGKLHPVGIYELLAFKKDEAHYADLVSHFNNAMAAYRRKSWEEAVEKFEAVLSKYPDDGPSEIFWERAQEFRKEAPAPEWDGVYVMKTK